MLTLGFEGLVEANAVAVTLCVHQHACDGEWSVLELQITDSIIQRPG
jgi:hypothetical protein